MTAAQAARHVEILKNWSARGVDTRGISPCPVVDWSSAARLIAVARRYMTAERQKLQTLLKQSRDRLKPLEEPFDIDLGLHRWLAADREEAYADWLEWVVSQLPNPQDVYQLFGIQWPQEHELRNVSPQIRREMSIDSGHADQTGRLDLVIEFGDAAIIVVEIKKGDADDADTAKHFGYMTWLHRQRHRHKHAVLLAAEAEHETYHGFDFRSWKHVAVELRRQAVAMKHDRVMRASLILAFVAAVEQNLLGYRAKTIAQIVSGSQLIFNVSIVTHMQNFIQGCES